MSTDVTGPMEDRLASLLAACDEVLAAGVPASSLCQAATPAEQRPRLERDLACVQLLRQLWPNGSDQATPAEASSASSRVAEPLAGEMATRLGRFEVLRELGRGGYGVVFLARDPKLGREVALKIPAASVLVNADLRLRFQHEARAAASLDHPHIVPVYESGEIGQICYIASAFCPGITLSAWLAKCTEPAPFDVAAALVATLAEAVQHAHSRGVLHRDLKPANILGSGGKMVYHFS